MPLARTSLVAAIAAVSFSSIASAATLFTDSFDATANANFTVLKGNTGANIAADSGTQAAEFGFDYSTFGIPSATGTSDTTGLRLRSNIFGGVQSGLSAFLTSQAVPTAGAYAVEFRTWSNYVKTGVSSTAAASYGLASGTRAQVVVNADGAYTASLRDNATSANGTYRNYVNGAFTSNIKGSTLTANFPSKTVVQSALVNGVITDNTVTTVAGTDSFAWRTVTITNDGTRIVTTITDDAGNPVTLSTVALSAITTPITNAFVGSFDTTAGSSFTASTTPSQADLDASAPVQFNFELFDAFTISTVTVVPEPTTLAALAGVGGLLISRRRAR